MKQAVLKQIILIITMTMSSFILAQSFSEENTNRSGGTAMQMPVSGKVKVEIEEVVNSLNCGKSAGDIIYGSEYVFNPSGSTHSSDMVSATALDDTHFVAVYQDRTNNRYGTAVIGTVSGNTISYSNEFVFNSSITTDLFVASISSTRFVLVFSDGIGGPGKGIIGDISGNSISFGSKYTYSSGSTQLSKVTKIDERSFVVIYTDDSNSDYGTSIVGTISGNSITYGTATVFNSGQTSYKSITTLDATHIVIAYRDQDYNGKAIVGTISGNNISFGAEFTFRSAQIRGTALVTLDDSHFVVSFKSISPTRGVAVVATVTGNSISYGADFIFESGILFYLSTTAMDDTHFIIAYNDLGVYSYSGVAIIATVSGNDISFGSSFTFNGADTGDISAISLNSSKFVVAYEDGENYLDLGTAIIGDVEEFSGITWNGLVNSDWNSTGNWSGNVVPTLTDEVVIANVSNQPIILADGTANCMDLTVNYGATLTIQSSAVGTGSLITSGTITNDGTINIQRYVTEDIWHYISSPIADVQAHFFQGNYLQNWNETIGLWEDIADGTTPLTPVKGFSLWDKTKAATLTFSGIPNTGNQSIAVTYTNNGGTGSDGANFLGNPYPSSIDWSRLDDTWGAISYWNGTAYETWNNGSGSGSQYVPPMQGFFIVVSANGTFQLTNDDRTHLGANTYYKSSEKINNSIVLAASNGSYSDELHLRFNEASSADFELQNDAYKFLSNTDGISQLYSFAGEKKFSIDVRPEEEVIQLGFQNNQNGNYQIGLSDISHISSVLLEDTKTETLHNLIDSDYEFEWNTTDNEKRFKLHLKATGIDNVQHQDIQLYANQKTIYIQSMESINYSQIIIVDMMGRVVYEDILSDGQNEAITLNVEDGVYIASLISKSGAYTEKVILK